RRARRRDQTAGLYAGHQRSGRFRHDVPGRDRKDVLRRRRSRVRLLLDTHLLLWAAGPSPRLSLQARGLIDAPDNELVVSAASLWEIAIKGGLRRPNFRIDAALLRRNLLNNSYQELAVTSEHAVAVANLP